MRASPSTKTTQPESEFVQLKDFLESCKLSYATYRRLRLRGLTPTEYKLTGKTILIKRTDMAKWVQKAMKKSPATPASR